MKKYVLLVILSAVAVQLSFAQTADTLTTSFVKNATMGNLMEIKTGQLAVKKGQSARVKAFGAQMVKDHSLANAQLKKIAIKKKYSTTVAPIIISPMLANESGGEFDKNYTMMMIADHQKTVDLFEKVANNSTDAEIKAFAAKLLPKLKQHLATVESISRSLQVSK